MKCGSCGGDRAVDEVRDYRYVYGDREVVIPALMARYCPDCGESAMKADEARQYSNAILQLRKEVNSAVVDPAFITSAREKLGLSREQAAELFGQPRRAFYGYESAARPVPVPLVQLLSVLGNHPELAAELPTVSYPEASSQDRESCCTRRGRLP